MTAKVLKKVLVVDDDPIVGRSIDRVLSARGYAVISAASGPEALEKLAREDYDVVYTDIKMPGMDGLEVAARIKASRPWLPVLIVTGYGTDANESKARDIGVSGFLRKPLSPEIIEWSAREATLAPEPLAARARRPEVETPAPAGAPEVERAVVRRPSALRTVSMLAAAPFLGLAFVVAFPFVALGLLVWTGLSATANRFPWVGRVGRFARNVGLFFAAPFIGLAYALAFPFVGIGLIGVHGYRAWMNKGKRS